MSSHPISRVVDDTVDYEYTKSVGAHGVHAHMRFDAFVGSDREIWIGNDGSGLIRESRGPVDFYTPQGKADWEAAGSPTLAHGRGLELYGPGCLSGSRARRRWLTDHPDGLGAALASRGRVTLHTVQELLSEAVVDPRFCRALYEVAEHLPGVETSDQIVDQLGRGRHSLVQTTGVHRVELVFDADISQLLGCQHVLAEPVEFGPAGTLHSWCAFLVRRLEPGLPADVPPVPQTPADRSGGGRSFRIRPGFSVTTGYRGDLLAGLAELHAQGVLTDSDHESAQITQAWAEFDDDTALAWRELGLKPTEARELSRTGSEPKELAAVWQMTGIPADEVADWIGAGLTPTEALEQRAHGVTSEDVAAMRSLRNPTGADNASRPS